MDSANKDGGAYNTSRVKMRKFSNSPFHHVIAWNIYLNYHVSLFKYNLYFYISLLVQFNYQRTL